jgi:hydrogenase/urease accessory protein HupE
VSAAHAAPRPSGAYAPHSIVLLFFASVALAHPLAPALLEVTELAPGQAEVRFKISALQAPGSMPVALLPPHCRELTAPATTVEDEALIRRWTVDCGPGGLVGQRFGVDGLGVARIDALVRVGLADGRVVRGVVRADDPWFTVPERQSTAAIVRSYAAIGVEHILGGLDHLLFVAGLLMLVRSRRLLIETVTAFTVGHSLTLALAVLDLVRVPSAPIELAIALSVFWLAVELARDEAARPTIVQRRPYIMAGLFGLLHGLGFASALQEVGLPPGDVPLALFAFNLGIELGQLAFIAVWLAVAAVLHRLPFTWPRWARQVPLYTMGSLAAFWCFERAAALLR